jgi:hypothetical protein
VPQEFFEKIALGDQKNPLNIYAFEFVLQEISCLAGFRLV